MTVFVLLSFISAAAAAATLCPTAAHVLPVLSIHNKCSATGRLAGGVAMRATSSTPQSSSSDDKDDGASKPLPADDMSAYTEPQATPQDLAAHLPDWAAEMMLDETSNAAYETDQVRRRASALNARRVEGRSWEGFEILSEEEQSLNGVVEGGSGVGMAEYTAEELAEDYQLPIETVVESMLQLGVDVARLRKNLRKPVKSVCSSQQLRELMAFLGGADPIACREALCERTLDEIAEEETPGLTSAQLLQLVSQEEAVAQVLGVEARLGTAEYAQLIERAEREIAFRGRPS